MIFVTVGAQMPFDRLVLTVDRWAGERGRTDVFAQIGPSGIEPRHIPWEVRLDPRTFREKVRACTTIVAHAGMGSILTALEFGKPILVMPRRGALKETRNDHQVATAERLKELGHVRVALDEKELVECLDQLESIPAPELVPPRASAELIEAIRGFIGS